MGKADQNNSEREHFSRSASLPNSSFMLGGVRMRVNNFVFKTSEWSPH